MDCAGREIAICIIMSKIALSGGCVWTLKNISALELQRMEGNVPSQCWSLVENKSIDVAGTQGCTHKYILSTNEYLFYIIFTFLGFDLHSEFLWMSHW